ncbi:ethylene-responsive transcription factor 11-like, partial [Triticum aestivum]|uniref:ethylene-responsive transcription factor 11-like n=1 Tax=Triticum aestivum TaxID=4565 RepID=UPI001D019CB6
RHCRRATVPPHHRETWGYRGVRARPSGGFSAETRFRGMRLSLGNFDTTNEAAHAYDAVAWRLRWPHRTLNFPNVPTQERVQELAPLSRFSTDEDRRDNQRREHCLGIAEMDEEAMVLWHQHFPRDIINAREFYVQRRAERDKRRVEQAAYSEEKRRREADAQFNMRLGAASPWESNDNRYLHAYTQTSEEDITEEELDNKE